MDKAERRVRNCKPATSRGACWQHSPAGQGVSPSCVPAHQCLPCQLIKSCSPGLWATSSLPSATPGPVTTPHLQELPIHDSRMLLQCYSWFSCSLVDAHVTQFPSDSEFQLLLNILPTACHVPGTVLCTLDSLTHIILIMTPWLQKGHVITERGLKRWTILV